MAALPHMFIWMDFLSMPQIGARGTITDTADVERSTLLLVLVPVALHVNRKEPCNFSTWRQRGWCRLELQAALFKCGLLRVMVCIGPEATPYFLFPTDAYQLLCGTGDFTCCQRNHWIN